MNYPPGLRDNENQIGRSKREIALPGGQHPLFSAEFPPPPPREEESAKRARSRTILSQERKRINHDGVFSRTNARHIDISFPCYLIRPFPSACLSEILRPLSSSLLPPPSIGIPGLEQRRELGYA